MQGGAFICYQCIQHVFFHENDSYSVIFPDLNYLATQGDTFEEAMEMAVDCLAGYLYTCQMDGDNIQKPSKLSDINPQAVAKEHFEKSVKKTLTIPAWLNNAALEKGINFSQVLQEALKVQLNFK